MAEVEISVPQNPWKILSVFLVLLLAVSLFFNIQTSTITGAVIAEDTEISADDDPFLGPENAPIEVIVFSDFGCPFCAGAAGYNEQVIEYLRSGNPSWEAPIPKLRELAEQGKVKLVFRDFPLHGTETAEAAECAHEQGKFWEYHDKLFENQDALEVEDLKKYAEELGLDTTKFNDCLDSGQMFTEIQKDYEDGNRYGVTGTPTFFINGEKVEGAQSFSVFERIIEES